MVVCAMSVSVVWAGDERAGLKVPDLNGGGPQEPYGGVVVDQTVTVFGHAFYQYFVSLWRDQPLGDRYAISIHERATARYGSQVWVEYAQRRMFQAFVPPSNAAIRAASGRAVAIVYQNIMDTDVQRLLFHDADLAADEM